MHITPFGIIFLLCAIFFSVLSYWLAKRMVIRQLGKSQGIKIVVAYWTLVIFFLNILFFPFVYLIGKEIYLLTTQPTFQAETVDFTSQWETCEDDGDTYSCLMHIPVFQFSLEDGTQIKLPGNIRSESEPVIGKIVNVVYQPDHTSVHELSLRSIGLLAGGILLLLVEGYILLIITAYALGYKIEKLVHAGKTAVLGFLVPLASSLFICVFLYVIYQYFFMGNPDDHPFWVIALCSLFTLALLPLMWTYINTAIKLITGRTDIT